MFVVRIWEYSDNYTNYELTGGESYVGFLIFMCTDASEVFISVPQIYLRFCRTNYNVKILRGDISSEYITRQGWW